VTGWSLALDRRVSHFEPLFEHDHLPLDLQAIAGPCAALAEHMIEALPRLDEVDQDELVEGLRQLLGAKDCFVRQAVMYRKARGSNGSTVG
jgi:hypothetical protein